MEVTLLNRIKNRFLLWNYKIKLKEYDYFNAGYCWNLRFNISGSGHKIVIENGASINDVIFTLKGKNHIVVIEKDVKFRSGEVWIEGNGNTVSIGKDTTIEETLFAAMETSNNIFIGEDCMISNDVVFRNGDSHSIIDLASGKRLNSSSTIELKNHVWIGANSTILKGVNISENSIVGIKSLVTKDIPNNTLVAGIPAKVIKHSINWSRDFI